MVHPPKNLRDPLSLVQIVAALRGPEGCPWDLEQTHQTLTPYAVEEVAELVEAIESGDDAKTKDELGDVLLQIVLHAQLAKERGAFDFEDVIANLNEKMVRRHPHVFTSDAGSGPAAGLAGGATVTSSAEVIRSWEQLKKAEKASRGEVPRLLDVPVQLPALQRAAKIGARTNKLKFDWENTEQVMEKVREEIAEFEEALDEDSHEAIIHELGDVLFSLAQASRHLGQDPEQCLRQANRRFEGRFEMMMTIAAEKKWIWTDLAPEQKEALWAEAKLRVK
jgi:tetrapyrrole methylase family protein/MazG family protein